MQQLFWRNSLYCFDTHSNLFLQKTFCLLRVILQVGLEFTLQDYLNNASVRWSNFASQVRVYITVLLQLIIIVADASSDSVLILPASYPSISCQTVKWVGTGISICDLICVCYKYFLRHAVTDYELILALFSLYCMTWLLIWNIHSEKW